MKKQRKRQPVSRKGARQKQQLQDAPNSRDFLGMAKAAAIGLPVVAGATFFGVRAVQASMAEADLTRIGGGVPSIVQIHDPQCSMCTTLQKQTRRALRQLPDDSYTYLVANIKTDAGLAFATRFSATHVTLLLFDPQGEMTQVVRGPLPSSDLEGILTAHMKTHGR